MSCTVSTDPRVLDGSRAVRDESQCTEVDLAAREEDLVLADTKEEQVEVDVSVDIHWSAEQTIRERLSWNNSVP